MDNGQIPQNLIDRINELANKKKTVGLTPEEKEEQKRALPSVGSDLYLYI